MSRGAPRVGRIRNVRLALQSQPPGGIHRKPSRLQSDTRNDSRDTRVRTSLSENRHEPPVSFSAIATVTESAQLERLSARLSNSIVSGFPSRDSTLNCWPVTSGRASNTRFPSDDSQARGRNVV